MNADDAEAQRLVARDALEERVGVSFDQAVLEFLLLEQAHCARLLRLHSSRYRRILYAEKSLDGYGPEAERANRLFPQLYIGSYTRFLRIFTVAYGRASGTIVYAFISEEDGTIHPHCGWGMISPKVVGSVFDADRGAGKFLYHAEIPDLDTSGDFLLPPY